jgi:ferredoxin
MTYVVTDKCIKCKYTDCAVVCPVNCFYEGDLMLVIDPDECIDCGVCAIECPISAIVPESKELIEQIERAKICSRKWPNITNKKDPLPDAEKYIDEENKFEKYMLNKI